MFLFHCANIQIFIAVQQTETHYFFLCWTVKRLPFAALYCKSGRGNLVLYLLINLTTIINETNEELTGHLPIIKRSFYCVFAIHGLECQSFNNIFVCLLKFYNKLLFYIFLLVLNVQKLKRCPQSNLL